ncbi:uncharacterized protein LOC9661183 isoform X2 [Selaginella moellendorffii]|uniref:uncharacterized protein LOC9661183 isoform X2 n=1 Tax=Selaginella moellendorffii TaxID=88036 RepID=UPI000D1CF094|nr:uncharacterized protein LOC9661183 isoform X2 [Selaginella moellendorffii]XP_024517434.1 uncharacterized protein LOC9661183 isoform X2 [Selaginella moellendorffii]|eukprot:XP_024517429.1 uncharacterized protein LOC9661183 isoform X2 [Selaginella moellendorffii]
MLRRALWSAWRWRSGGPAFPRDAATRSIDSHRNPLTRSFEIFQVRGFGVANVWIDRETAAARAAQRTLRPRRHKVKPAEGEEKPAARPAPRKSIGLSRESRRLLRKGERMRTWKDGTPRPPGPEGSLRMLDSGKLLGRDRKTMVQKYGTPKRIPRKIRLEKLEERRQRKELKMKLALNPELKEELLKKSLPTDSGAVRRLREKSESFSRMNKMEKRRDVEEKEAAVYFSQPLKCDQKKVATVYGDIDVTAAAKYKEWKAQKKEQIASKTLQIEAGDGSRPAGGDDALARLRKKALKVKREAENQKLLPARNKEDLVEDDGNAQEIREKAKKMIEEGKELLKLVDEEYHESSIVLEEEEVEGAKRKLTRGLILENEANRKRSDRHTATAGTSGSKSESSENPKAETETEKYLRKSSQLSEESKANILDIGKPAASAEIKVDLMSDEETFSDEEKKEKLTWGLDSTRPMDGTDEGRKLSRVLGTNMLLGFPRLTKAKKTRPARTTTRPDEEDIVLSPQVDETHSNIITPTLYQPEERGLSLERQIIEKTLEEYHMILQSERATPRKKPWIRRVLKIDKDDITAKRYETPEERKASGKVEPKELGTNARFRMIQPSRELMRYIDSQLLGKRRLDEWRKAGYNVKLYSPLDNVPFYKGEKKYRIHQSIFRNKQVFVAGAKVLSSIPPAELPEIAFAGRTNSGKSKLINALTRQYGRARTSPKPGKTDSINFYVLGEKLCLVDMPGYSFMYGKQDQIQDLRQLNMDYITVRDHLKRVCLLIDAEWGIRQKDQEFIDFLESVNRKYQIVLTKTDKVLPLDLGRRVTQIEEVIKDCKYHVSPVMMVSAKSGAGIGKFRMALASLL